jgi:hypothetical protein
MPYTISSQNIDLSSWITLCIVTGQGPLVQVYDQASERWEDKLLDLAIIFILFFRQVIPVVI